MICRCVWASGLSVLLSFGTPCFAQTRAYETPLYSAPRTGGLDPNFGMPSVGRTGRQVPPRRGTASLERDDDKLGFFDQKRDDTGLRSARRDGAFASDMETPSFTTQDSQGESGPPSYDSSTDTK